MQPNILVCCGQDKDRTKIIFFMQGCGGKRQQYSTWIWHWMLNLESHGPTHFFQTASFLPLWLWKEEFEVCGQQCVVKACKENKGLHGIFTAQNFSTLNSSMVVLLPQLNTFGISNYMQICLIGIKYRGQRMKLFVMYNLAYFNAEL